MADCAQYQAELDLRKKEFERLTVSLNRYYGRISDLKNSADTYELLNNIASQAEALEYIVGELNDFAKKAAADKCPIYVQFDFLKGDVRTSLAKAKDTEKQLTAKARQFENSVCEQLSDEASDTFIQANKLKSRIDTYKNQLTNATGAILGNIVSSIAREEESLNVAIATLTRIQENAKRDNCAQAASTAASHLNSLNSLKSQINTLKTEVGNKQQATAATGASGATGPTNLPGASGATGASGVAGGSGATGPTPIDPNSPALGNAGPVEVTEPKINFGEDTSSDPGNTNNGLPGDIDDAQAEASYQDTVNFQKKEDWRVRLSLSPGADYLYKVPNGQAGILNPLQETDGVIFPYTPTINVNYTASYDATNLTHSNYKIYQYQSSSVDSISIACDFTAQDTYEANYLLAVIHFFRSLTKMFYGQDENPKPGTPPPLVYLFGLGAFQFEAHPLVITNFSYNLPADVDYIRATNSFQNAGINQSPGTSRGDTSDPSQQRLTSGPNANIAPGGKAAPANFPPSRDGTNDPTYVPTKINISLSAYPIVSRYDISRNFSVKKYATGELLRGTTRSGGGIW